MFKLRQSHIVGLVVGALAGAIVSALSRALGVSITIGDGLFWGAVLGSMLAGVPQFAQSGAVLTRRENPTVNLVVGLLASLVFLLFVVWLANALSEPFF